MVKKYLTWSSVDLLGACVSALADSGGGGGGGAHRI